MLEIDTAKVKDKGQNIPEARAWIETSQSALLHNIREIQNFMPGTKIMAIVKADAYGHGDVALAKALEKAGIDFFATATTKEAVDLRKAGLKGDILILGYTNPELFEDLIDYNLVQSVISKDYAEKMVQSQLPIRVHVKLDTGMNRSGLIYKADEKSRKDLLEIYQLPIIQIEGIYSHLCVSDQYDKESMEFSRKQIARYEDALKTLKANDINPGLSHIQNSYGIMTFGPLGYDYCRPGLLYMGVGEGKDFPYFHELNLKPALSLKTRIALVKEITPGESVSYGRNYISDKSGKIAVIAIGYADGLFRSCSNKGLEVLVQGKRVPVIGNICMDQCMIDVSDLQDVGEGEEVILIGEQNGVRLSIDQISALAQTINNETLSRLSSRLERKFVE